MRSQSNDLRYRKIKFSVKLIEISIVHLRQTTCIRIELSVVYQLTSPIV